MTDAFCLIREIVASSSLQSPLSHKDNLAPSKKKKENQYPA
jgi:hypothetical protein